jgi:membrane protease YdiL (CAAX protease family)
MALPAILLVLCLGGLLWFLRNDLAEYAAFKRLTDTRDRQKRYRVWILKAFLLFVCGSLVCLAILRRLANLLSLPSEFHDVSQRLHAAIPADHAPGKAFLLPFFGAVILGMLAGLLITTVLRRRSNRSKPARLGDIDALMPRNAPETLWMTVMSVNAGIGEELFFRLLLPLLLTILCRNALLAFVIAAAVFGLVHLYQRLPGILATAAVGAALSCLYLWTANLWIAILAHALLDLVGAVLRPAAERLLRPAA